APAPQAWPRAPARSPTSAACCSPPMTWCCACSAARPGPRSSRPATGSASPANGSWTRPGSAPTSAAPKDPGNDRSPDHPAPAAHLHQWPPNTARNSEELADMITHRLALIASVAAAVVLAGAAGIPARASVPESAPVAGWSITPSPNARAANGALNAVSCPTTAVCTAVGLHVRDSWVGVTLAERRSGGVWAVQPTPNPHGAAASALNGVSCPSGSACTAVGQFAVKSGAQRTLAERWNGRSWRIQRTPNPARSPSSRLSAVACPATDACTAVGSSNSKLLVEQWGG